MNGHIDDLDVARFRAGKLDRAAVERIGAHVRSCTRCAARVWGSAEVSQSAAAVSRNASANPTRIRWIAAAAVLLIAIAAGLLVAYSARRGASPRSVIPPQRVAVPRPVHPWDALVANALRTGTLEPAVALLALRKGGGEVQRGPGPREGEVRLVAPVGVAVDSASPQFRWTPHGSSSIVTIARGGEVVARSGRVTEASWTPSAPLQRGAVYEWQLAVEEHGRRRRVPAAEDPPARFRVLSDDESRLLASVRASGDPLAAAIVAAHLGLLDDALPPLEASADPRARALAEKIRRW